MGKAEWGADPEFFGPRHAHREDRLARTIERRAPAAGRHLECAAGVGSLSLTLARGGRTVVAADRSLRSLAVVARRAERAGLAGSVLPVVADITRLPFADRTFPCVSSAETLEHIPADRAAARELARVLAPEGWLVGTVPAGPEQWSDWDDWGGHLRRYRAPAMRRMLADAGLDPEVTVWGWPVLRLYDDVFMRRVNRRRLRHDGPLDADPALATVAGLGRRRWLVGLVRRCFQLDRLFDGAPWGVGLLFEARKPAASE
ncbi:MAG: class I SAM-dependent methyltransferase [Thermoanaerobaculales bacterium]|jgi:SAM-dependent methyltransferase|nr:class I SAM-dependent methyltransferase [Thermoanaerobaculales bacterium]